MKGEDLRRRTSAILEVTEQVIYGLLALLLAATALVAIASAAKTLLGALRGDMSLEVSQALNALILVLMAVEILNTVRISIRSRPPATGPSPAPKPVMLSGRRSPRARESREM